jgi:nucleotide-binding universal stress UspA family protein
MAARRSTSASSRALGSVSERVAHQAQCSVLIVREPPWQRIAEALDR